MFDGLAQFAFDASECFLELRHTIFECVRIRISDGVDRGMRLIQCRAIVVRRNGFDATNSNCVDDVVGDIAFRLTSRGFLWLPRRQRLKRRSVIVGSRNL